MIIEFKDFSIECNVEYGKRKKIMLTIEPNGFIKIKAPNGTTEEQIKNAFIPLENKLKKKLEEHEKLRSGFGEKTYDEQGLFMYLGKEYPLEELIQIEDLTEDEKRASLKRFYMSDCKRIVGERLKIYEKQLKVNAKEFKIDESKSKWGSCSSERKLTFNYRLIMAPLETIDYVVVHELCHIKHMNHDRSFWRLVGSILPDYKERQDYLKKYGQFLTL